MLLIVPRGEHCAAALHVPQRPKSYIESTLQQPRVVGTKVCLDFGEEEGFSLVADDDDHHAS